MIERGMVRGMVSDAEGALDNAKSSLGDSDLPSTWEWMDRAWNIAAKLLNGGFETEAQGILTSLGAFRPLVDELTERLY